MLTSLFLLLGMFSLNTARTTLVIEAEQGKEPLIVYHGSREAAPADIATVRASGAKPQRAYPVYDMRVGELAIGNPAYALAVTQSDGAFTLDLAIENASVRRWENGEILEVVSRDKYYPVTVKNCWKSYEKEDLFETWVEITNGGKKDISLRRYYSGVLPIHKGNVHVSTFGGSWGDEARMVTAPLDNGIRLVRNIDGIRNAQSSHSEAMISLDGAPQENSGRVIGAALCWGGNYDLMFSTMAKHNYHWFLAGICPDNAEYHLEPRGTFTTPALAYSFSNEGLSGVSRNFHRWGRKYRLAHGDKERKILLNSWEGVYTRVSEPVLDKMMADWSELGGELFVLDDGWFGGKYKRTPTDCALGDWVVDKEKLPHGIPGLVQSAGRKGLKFGIWIEPEMTNTKSELFEKHPDWVLRPLHHAPIYGRGGTQLILDFTNPEVQDFIFGVVDGLMKQDPGLDYIKWDCNASIGAAGSPRLKYQSHLQAEFWAGFKKTLDRIRAAYPDLTIQTCSSGGGRASWGILPWFDEFWVSDNSDACQRVYMQWTASYFYPAITMASHISAVPNHQTGRVTSMKFRIHVAMSGRLGMEMQPKDMNPEEKELVREALVQYKRIRPVVQFGDIYRLHSPYEDGKFSSLMYCSEQKDKAVFYWFRLDNDRTHHIFPAVPMAGLDPNRNYKVEELVRGSSKPCAFEGKVFSGKFLMEHGLEMPYVHAEGKTEWSSHVLYLQAQ